MTVYCYYKSSFIDEFYDEVLAQPVAHIQHLHRGISCGIMLCRHSMASSMTSAWNHFNYLPTSWMSWISVWLIFWLSLIAFMKISTGYSHVYYSCLFSSIMICRPALKHRGANRYFSWMWRWRELILACDRLINKRWTRTPGERYIPAPSPRWRSLWERQFHPQLSQSFTYCRLHSGAWNILWHLRL